ncbi:uncharacterized protein PB18E9.04c-like isoform X5 [Haliotis rubra]|uniref:uncharacterized protein PB18E9.04c-like isoform X5 n=1 Tax=Haliotis rubra TaxID=36100 RepID=UPI001EE51F7F|nr:uncharacterized protein PB18E9.04c-like isoform X5 [Haliotis rubra]
MSTSGSVAVLLLSIVLACQARVDADIPRQADVEDPAKEMSPQHYVTVSAPAGTITSPGYPGKYPPNLSSVLLSIGVPYDETEGYVSLHFTWFDIQMCPFCNCDYLYVDSLKTSLCGDSLPPSYVNNTIIIARSEIRNNLITLSFRSDSREEHSGFVINYELHVHRPGHAQTTPFTTSVCPAITCPTCPAGEVPKTTYTSPCPKCVCTAETPSTKLPSSRCPVLTCPRCPPGQTPERHYTLPCSTCVCTAVTPSTQLPPSKCPVLTCPTCPQGQTSQIRYTLPCSTCVCTAVTPSTKLPPSKCPVLTCPTCPQGQTSEIRYTSPCSTCVCTAVTPSTKLPPSKCPVLTCPTCPPGQTSEIRYTSPCSTCVCTAVTPFTKLPPSKCPVVICPACPPWLKAERQYDKACPRCTCVRYYTSSTPPQRKTTTAAGRPPMMLLQMLQNVAHRAETLEYAARDMKEEMRIAINLLLQSQIQNDTPKLPDSVEGVKLPAV